MKYIKLGILSLIFLGGVLWISSFIDKSLELQDISLATVASVVTVGVSIPTLIIALLLYRKFSGSQTLVDRQTHEVMNILDTISQVGFVFMLYSGKPGGLKGALFTNIALEDQALPSSHTLKLEDLKAKGTPFYANSHTIRLLDYLGDQASSVYMPRKIALQLEEYFASGDAYLGEGISKDTDYVEVIVSSNRLETKIEGKPALERELDFEYTAKALQTVHKTARLWVRKNNYEVYTSLNLKKF